jgi:hypothetical protein
MAFADGLRRKNVIFAHSALISTRVTY